MAGSPGLSIAVFRTERLAVPEAPGRRSTEFSGPRTTELASVMVAVWVTPLREALAQTPREVAAPPTTVSCLASTVAVAADPTGAAASPDVPVVPRSKSELSIRSVPASTDAPVSVPRKVTRETVSVAATSWR